MAAAWICIQSFFWPTGFWAPPENDSCCSTGWMQRNRPADHLSLNIDYDKNFWFSFFLNLHGWIRDCFDFCPLRWTSKGKTVNNLLIQQTMLNHGLFRQNSNILVKSRVQKSDVNIWTTASLCAETREEPNWRQGLYAHLLLPVRMKINGFCMYKSCQAILLSVLACKAWII